MNMKIDMYKISNFKISKCSPFFLQLRLPIWVLASSHLPSWPTGLRRSWTTDSSVLRTNLPSESLLHFRRRTQGYSTSAALVPKFSTRHMAWRCMLGGEYVACVTKSCNFFFTHRFTGLWVRRKFENNLIRFKLRHHRSCVPCERVAFTTQS